MKRILKVLTIILSISLILLGCGQKQATESKKETSKIDFGGKTMNVVATSEKYKNYLISSRLKQIVKLSFYQCLVEK